MSSPIYSGTKIQDQVFQQLQTLLPKESMVKSASVKDEDLDVVASLTKTLVKQASELEATHPVVVDGIDDVLSFVEKEVM